MTINTTADIVARGAILNVSSLVTTIAAMPLVSPGKKLIAQARELIKEVPDYEEAAIQAGYALTQTSNDNVVWRIDGEPDNTSSEWDTAEELCKDQGIKPHLWEVYEFWAVDDVLAGHLAAQGERVDTDFGGLMVWARTNTGQVIAADEVIESITRRINRVDQQ